MCLWDRLLLYLVQFKNTKKLPYTGMAKEVGFFQPLFIWR